MSCCADDVGGALLYKINNNGMLINRYIYILEYK